MACGMQTQSARRAVGLATTATLEVFEEKEIGSYRKAIPGPRRCLETARKGPERATIAVALVPGKHQTTATA